MECDRLPKTLKLLCRGFSLSLPHTSVLPAEDGRNEKLAALLTTCPKNGKGQVNLGGFTCFLGFSVC